MHQGIATSILLICVPPALLTTIKFSSAHFRLAPPPSACIFIPRQQAPRANTAAVHVRRDGNRLRSSRFLHSEVRRGCGNYAESQEYQARSTPSWNDGTRRWRARMTVLRHYLLPRYPFNNELPAPYRPRVACLIVAAVSFLRASVHVRRIGQPH